MSDLLDIYLDPADLDPDGYPHAWTRCPTCDGQRYIEVSWIENAFDPVCTDCAGEGSIKDLVRAHAGHRCVRCGHPYRKGEHGNGEWSPCDTTCTHLGPIRSREVYRGDGAWAEHDLDRIGQPAGEGIMDEGPGGQPMVRWEVEAQWRILTVHHLNGIKHDCRWWNLAALCQRCHLSIQTRVIMERPYDRPHSDWFKPYAAGFYASLLGEEISREEAVERMDELLDPHHRQGALL